MKLRTRLLPAVLLAAATLSGCDLLGIEPASALIARKEAEGKAVGGACRHAGRAIEDCYALNKKADKASVFAGWREMNDYMRENKIDEVRPQAVPEAAEKAEKADKAERLEKSGKADDEAPAAKKAAKH